MSSTSSFAADAGLGAGTPAVDSSCAPGDATPTISSHDAQKLRALWVLSKDFGLFGGARSGDETLNPELQPNDVERPSVSPRRLGLDASPITSEPVGEVGEWGRDCNQQGRAGSPSISELVEVLRCMLCGDETTPLRSDCGWELASATTGLAVLVVAAVEALYTELGVPKGQSLPCTDGPVDREEAYGYLMADVLGSALLSVTGARYVGERARKRNTAHAAALPEAKKQAKKQAKRDAVKAGTDPDAKAADDTERTLLDAPLEFEMPAPRPPPPKPARASQKRKRAEPAAEPAQRSEFDVPSCEEQLAAYRTAFDEVEAAYAACMTAVAVVSSALDACARAQSQEDAILALCEAEEDWHTPGWALSSKECNRLDLLDRQRVRAEQKLLDVTAEHEAAVLALATAKAVVAEKSAILARIKDWIKYPDVVTPFPWPGEPYIMPCNRMTWNTMRHARAASPTVSASGESACSLIIEQ